MLLMQKPSELDKIVLEYFKDCLGDMIYCLDLDLYKLLKNEEIAVDMAYLTNGIIYLCDGTIYKGEVIINKSIIQEQFHRYNRCTLTTESSFRTFLKMYPEIYTQDIFLSEID